MKKFFPFLFWNTFIIAMLFKVGMALAQSSGTDSQNSGGNSGFVIFAIVATVVGTIIFALIGSLTGKK
jgi:hypothetical protein